MINTTASTEKFSDPLSMKNTGTGDKMAQIPQVKQEGNHETKEQVMIHTTASTEKLDAALAHLNEAAKERREDLQKLLAEKYTDLGAAIGSVAGASATWMKEQGREVGDKAKLAASTVDHSLRLHPWYYVGGAALGGLLIGLLIARPRGRHDAA